MELSKREHYSALYETYKNFLTQTQRQSLELYLLEDIGISEIARITATSRQAANDAVKKGLRRLDDINKKLVE